MIHTTTDPADSTLPTPITADVVRIRSADTTASAANVRMSTYDSRAIPRAIDNWDDLDSDKHRVFALAEAVDRGLLDPRRDYAHNSTSRDLHELVWHMLSPGSSETRTIDRLAIGGSATEPSHTDRTLVGEIGTTEIAVAEVEQNSLYVNTFVGTGEFNGHTLRELGLLAGTRLMNRSLISSTVKDPTKTITVEVVLTLQDIEEVTQPTTNTGEI